MSREWNDDLRRRQQAGEVGFLGQAGQRRFKRRGLYVGPVVVLVGILLVYVGPVPGLGLFMTIAGALAFAASFVAGWLGD